MISEEQDTEEKTREALIRRLKRETGISDAQARELLAHFSANYPVLLREARNIQRYR